MNTDRWLTVGLKAVKQAEAVILKHYHAAESFVESDQKADHTPVTAADREAEHVIASTLRKAFPDHGVLGEEHGRQGYGNEFEWLVDPIDGTRFFTRKLPFFGTLLSLRRLRSDDRLETVLGIVHLPMMNKTLFASQGHGTFLNQQQVRVSSVDTLNQAYVSHSRYKHIVNSRTIKALKRISRQSLFASSLAVPYSIQLLCQGRIDAHLEVSPGSLWDTGPC